MISAVTAAKTCWLREAAPEGCTTQHQLPAQETPRHIIIIIIIMGGECGNLGEEVRETGGVPTEQHP